MPVDNVYRNISNIIRRIESIKRRFGMAPKNPGFKAQYAVRKYAGTQEADTNTRSGSSETSFSEALAKESAEIGLQGNHEGISVKKAETVDSSSDGVDRIIKAASERYGIPEELIRAIIHQESGFDNSALSSKGAMGLMQLMPETARTLGVENPFNPEENVLGGTRYLVDLLNQYNGNLNLALAAYNAGPNRVQNEIPGIPETREFIDSVLKRYRSYQKFNKEEL